MLWLSIEMLKIPNRAVSVFKVKINVHFIMFKCTPILLRLFDDHTHVLRSSLECRQVVLKIS